MGRATARAEAITPGGVVSAARSLHGWDVTRRARPIRAHRRRRM